MRCIYASCIVCFRHFEHTFNVGRIVDLFLIYTTKCSDIVQTIHIVQVRLNDKIGFFNIADAVNIKLNFFLMLYFI